MNDQEIEKIVDIICDYLFGPEEPEEPIIVDTQGEVPASWCTII